MTAAPSQQTYFYSAMTPAGARRRGLRSCTGETELVELLGRDNMLLLRAWRLPIGGAQARKISAGDEVAINEQLASLLDRGVTLVEALEVAASVVSVAARPRIEKLRELVAAGASFAAACEQVGGFDTVTIAVYRAAERSGDLAPAARRLASAARRKQAMKGKAITVMIYPLVVVTVSIIIMGGLMTFLVPQIARQVYQLSGGGGIPWYSKAVFSTGLWLEANIAAAGLFLLGLLFVCLLLRNEVLRLALAVFRKIKAIATLLRAIELTRLFAVLAAMTRSGVPLAEALALSTAVISDPKVREQLEWLQHSLVEGGVLRKLIEEVDTLPLATRRLLIAAERGGDLDQAFDSLSADMAEDVEVRSTRLLALLEPLVIIGMFAILGPLIIAIAVPLMTFRGNVGG